MLVRAWRSAQQRGGAARDSAARRVRL